MKTWFEILLNKYNSIVKIKEYKTNDIIVTKKTNRFCNLIFFTFLNITK